MPEPGRFIAYLPDVDPFLSGTGLKKYGSTGDKYGGTGQKLNSEFGSKNSKGIHPHLSQTNILYLILKLIS